MNVFGTLGLQKIENPCNFQEKKNVWEIVRANEMLKGIT